MLKDCHTCNRKKILSALWLCALIWNQGVTDAEWPLLSHALSQALVVRLLFTLGNLTAKIHEARQQLFECDGCMGTLLQLYDSYQRRDDSEQSTPLKGPACPSRPPAPAVGPKEDEDVLVKLVRVLANMCIHPAVGPALAANTGCIQLLMETLGEQDYCSQCLSN